MRILELLSPIMFLAWRLILLGGFLGAMAEVANAAEPEIRNVVMIVSDDLKASVLGAYGDPFCKTPHIDRLAAQGMVFERAYCQGVHCAPSRRSFMYSRYQDVGPVNLGEHFQDHGWFSARVGKIYHMRVPGDIIAGTNGLDVASSWTERYNSTGLEAHTPGDYACLNLNIFTDALENRESTRMKHRMFVTVQYDGDGSDQPDHKSATKAIELMREHQEDPFFLAVGLVRPHYPMVAPREYFDAYPYQELPLPAARRDDWDDIPKLGIAGTNNDKNQIGRYPDNQKRMWSGYYASVAFMDAQVGRIMDELEALGLKENTAVVFLSDHGYHLGEHGFWQKSNLHEEVVRVPLILSVPGMTPGRSESIVELVDVFPTVADLAGLPIPDSVQGTSLVPVLKNPNAQVKPGALSFHNGHSLRVPGWHYIRYNDGSEELYDARMDPHEFDNLASEPRYAERIAEMRVELRDRLREFGMNAR